ncbi:hypothetical protein Syun_010813 [Stephania yunnanensis]|uniref:Major facilitator superfamily (MFS) profile domain-containing protein n=1 Tax=Stephania yunnanensis TaxID=152371 RepID=A0AAP0KJB5_9MAGN
MSSGGGVIVSSTACKEYPGRFTCFVFFACLVAACGGLMFGYDIGISGGVTSMSPFLEAFFPDVYRKEQGIVSSNHYCKFDSHELTFFTSSLYLAALLSQFPASFTASKCGRKLSIVVAGIVFLFGAALNAAAFHVSMLYLGRILLGVGVGFALQAVPLYISEMATSKFRGSLNTMFQLMITIGIFAANLINYGSNKIKGGWGWRLSLGLAAVPAAIVLVGSMCLPDTPNSMIERGVSEEDVKRNLQRLRGTANIHQEYHDLCEACANASEAKNNTKWWTIFQRKYRPQMVMAFLIPFFQQLTGINVIMFYAPVLFRTLGFDNPLEPVAITGGFNVFATVFAFFMVDWLGRRFLFLVGGFQMLACQLIIGSFIGKVFGVAGLASVPKEIVLWIASFICVFVAGFAWSWGPLGWLIPSEIFPLEIRSTGQSINAMINMLMTFVIGQVFLSLLCATKFALFYIFAFFVLSMTLYVTFFLPETKGIPIEDMSKVWSQHWFWRRFVPSETSFRLAV